MRGEGGEASLENVQSVRVMSAGGGGLKMSSQLVTEERCLFFYNSSLFTSDSKEQNGLSSVVMQWGKASSVQRGHYSVL